MKKFTLLTVLIAVLALVLSACTANGNTAGSATATAGAAATTASAVLPNTGATATPTTAPAATTAPTATPAATNTPAATATAAATAGAAATTAPSVAQAENAYQATKVIGFDVKDPQGNELGKVSDLIVSRTSGLIDYAVFSSGGILGAGAKDIPVPWSGLKLTTPNNGDQYFVINTTKDSLDKAPTVNLDNLPSIAAGKWDVDIRSYWANLVPTLPQTGTTSTAGAPLILKDDVNKLTVLSAAGQELGHIDDMILDPVKGRILYAVLAAGDALNVGNKLIPVPFRDIRWTTTDNGKTTTPVVNVSEAQLQKAPSFDSWDKFPNLTVSNWDATLVRYWGVR